MNYLFNYNLHVFCFLIVRKSANTALKKLFEIKSISGSTAHCLWETIAHTQHCLSEQHY
jgi:hypothetical protein